VIGSPKVMPLANRPGRIGVGVVGDTTMPETAQGSWPHDRPILPVSAQCGLLAIENQAPRPAGELSSRHPRVERACTMAIQGPTGNANGMLGHGIG